MDLLESRDIDCNYIYDEYIDNSKLMDGLVGAFTLDLSESLTLIRFLEYLPNGVESIEKTKTKDELIAVKRDALVADAIKHKLRGDEYDEILYDYATKIDIKKLIDHKFTTFSFKDRCNYYNGLSNDKKEQMVNEYESRFDLNTEELALLCFMKSKAIGKVKKISSK